MKIKILLITPLCFFFFLNNLFGQNGVSWGDQGNGTYINPILNSDYSDPDVIRVEDKYYMVCSDFHYIGMPVLESDDMINWRIIGQIFDKFDYPGWNGNKHYGGGTWAPSIRYHDGKFWVFFCTPDEGLFMSNAVNPAGPWSPLYAVKEIANWEDPCPFWDEDGKAYLGHSLLGGGPIILHRMSPDGKSLLDEGNVIYTGLGAEGTKFYKKDGWYYLSVPEGGTIAGWQTLLRSKYIYGPYEKKEVLESGSTDINGPHQGAIVDTPGGEWWFYHFQCTEPLGRVLYLEPARWKDGWPVLGVDIDMNGIGEPVHVWTKPNVAKLNKPFSPQSSDDFSSPTLGVQWQFNHNQVNRAWSLTEKLGWLTVKALKADSLRDSRNMFSQKSIGYEGEVSTEMDISKMEEGQRSGLFCMSNLFNGIGVVRKDGGNFIYLEKDGGCQIIEPIKGNTVYLKIALDALNNTHQLFYSLDNKRFIPCSEKYSLKPCFWKGSHVGLFSYNTKNEAGKVFFNWFKYRHDGPEEYK
jgi:beta-xylosidase